MIFISPNNHFLLRMLQMFYLIGMNQMMKGISFFNVEFLKSLKPSAHVVGAEINAQFQQFKRREDRHPEKYSRCHFLPTYHLDISEWEEDADEYLRKNLPSDLEEISGWKDDLFTVKKSAINLLGVISTSKGPQTMTSGKTLAAPAKRKKGEKTKGKERRCSVGELLVILFLSKFPIPSSFTLTPSNSLHDYYGVLMAYGGLEDFLRERNPEYMTTLVRNRLLPLYLISPYMPYLVATANWVLGELASCLPNEMSADIYCSWLKAY